jgi:uncharacterized membrane protein YdfJ with MMPL/SSD domain
VEGIKHVAGIRETVADAVKGTPLENAKVSLAGTASLYSDMQKGVTVDLLIACIAAMILIFAIMLIITRSVVAALVIVGTVAASLGTACGLSVLLWQDVLGLGVQWIVLPLSIVILLAVGSDYNLLVVSRLKEEIPAGHDHRHRTTRRHAHRALLHDPLDRRGARAMVLVATEHLQDREERRSRARTRREHRADLNCADIVNWQH